jgi:hypothetical protein
VGHCLEIRVQMAEHRVQFSVVSIQLSVWVGFGVGFG